MRTETKYDKLVGQKENEFYFVDDIFKYDDGMQGVTGTILVPVSKEEYEDRTSNEAKYDYLDNSGSWEEAVKSGRTEESKQDYYQNIIDIAGDELIFDFSGSDLWDQLRSIDYDEENYPVIECVGGGRCFKSKNNFDKVFDKELLKKVEMQEENND